MTINSAFIVSGTQIILICVSTHTEMQRGVMNSILKMKDWNSEGFWGLLWIISERGFESRQPVLRVLCAMPPDHRSLLWGLRFSLHVGQRLTVKFSELILLWSVDLMRSLKTLAYWMRLCPPPLLTMSPVFQRMWPRFTGWLLTTDEQNFMNGAYNLNLGKMKIPTNGPSRTDELPVRMGVKGQGGPWERGTMSEGKERVGSRNVEMLQTNAGPLIILWSACAARDDHPSPHAKSQMVLLDWTERGKIGVSVISTGGFLSVLLNALTPAPSTMPGVWRVCQDMCPAND